MERENIEVIPLDFSFLNSNITNTIVLVWKITVLSIQQYFPIIYLESPDV